MRQMRIKLPTAKGCEPKQDDCRRRQTCPDPKMQPVVPGGAKLPSIAMPVGTSDIAGRLRCRPVHGALVVTSTTDADTYNLPIAFALLLGHLLRHMKIGLPSVQSRHTKPAHRLRDLN